MAERESTKRVNAMTYLSFYVIPRAAKSKKIRLNISRKKFKPTNYFSIIIKTCLHNIPTIIARTLKVKNATKTTYGNCLGSFPENCGVKSTIGFSSNNETFDENLDETKLEIKILKE